MANFHRPTSFRRFLAGLLSLLLALGPVATPAYAAVTSLADEPLATRNQSKPNILMTVDDSTSMLYDFLPDYVIDAYCRSGSGKMDTLCGYGGSVYDFTAAIPTGGKLLTPGYIYQQYNVPYKAYIGAAGAFDVSGPGAGCELVNPPFRCSTGVDPTTGGTDLVGLKNYPANNATTNPTASPQAGRPFEYWLLWPAPAHNSALNKLYYNPRLTYDPPIGDDGNPLPNMSAANTSNWTQVPADPWAATVVKVDLTAKVTVGQWCNSDWTQGNDGSGNPFVTNAGFVRTNGTVDATSSPAADGDYSYPWPPVGITADDPFSKVDSATYAVKGAWTTFKSSATASQNFYQNDNVIWCDVNSPAWPRGTTTGSQFCDGEKTQTCSGTTPGACVGVGTGTCPAAPTPGCTGSSAQTCNGLTSQVCNGIQSQTCVGSQPACSPVAQTCSTGTAQTCNSTSQTCNNVKTQTCNVSAQSCNVDNSTCTNVWQPAGCNLLADPESVNCKLVQQCSKKCSISNTACSSGADCADVGKCSVSNAACTAANAATNCPTIAGTCSSTGTSCTSAAQCSSLKKCSVTGADCSSTACSNTGRTCSITGADCTSSGTCATTNRCGGTSGGAACTTSPNNCAIVGGKCSIQTGTSCTTNANCPTVPGTCSVSGASCTSNANCPATGTGTCSLSGLPCTANNCPTVSGTCNANSANQGTACTANSQCTTKLRYCSNQPTKTCTANSQCTLGGTCSATSGNAGAACTSNSNCTTKPGTCDANAANAGTSCTKDSNCTKKTGVCSFTGATCAANSDCKDALPPISAVCSTGGVNGVAAATLIADANGAGLTCRRNNKDYTGVNAARNNYPDATYNVPVTDVRRSDGATVGNACAATPRYKLVPRHYWKTSVEWCDKAIATAGDKWNGFGTATGGSCQSFKDSTHVYPRYYQFGADPGTDNVTKPAFERIDLDIAKRSTATFTHTWKDSQGTTETITRTFDGATADVSEMTNYANWFAYYRTRIQAVKTVTSLAFNDLTPGTDYRVGFHTLSNAPTTTFQNIALFDAAQRKAWVQKLFGIGITLNKDTPNLEAMVRVGEYFANGGSGDLAGSTDPIVLSCQKNWHMLFTDGITNQQKVPTKDVQNQDKTVPTLPETVTTIPALVPGQPWPPLFIEGSAASTNNSAADYATYYWVTDLRSSGATAKNNVPGGDSDPATWQHLNFAALSLGTEGKLAAGNQSDTEKQIAAGSLEWSQPFPTVNKPDESGVDDLWHAAINGRGRFVNAQSAEELRAGMGAILADIANQPGSRAGAGLTGAKLSGNSNYVYRVGFDKGWSGSLIKVQIDAKTGKETPIWNAADQLTTQVTKTVATPEPWFTNRRVVTRDETGKPQPFLWDKLPNLQNSFAPGKPTRGKALVAYLRGSTENEGTEAGKFRSRAKALGDIVNGSPVYVGAPNFPYKEINDAGYPAWKASVSRPAMIYVGANDGMLHAFDDASGGESWAYVPSALYRKPDPPESVGATYPNLLGALAFQEGALPKFKHRFMVDGPITVTDANIAGSWKTILVGGLGKGGKSFYAVDVTDPANVKTEADAAAALMWEFNDPDLGYSFGKPLVTKTNAFGKKWLVVVSSGYNNPSGEGKLWFLDAKDGTVLKVLSTGVGSAGTPSGLAQFSAYTQDQTNYLADQIYAGDLLGNFWRFDVSDADSGNWKVEKMATLTSPSGVAQPVTTAPQIEIDIANGVDRWVFVGTGKLLHENDLADTAVQTLYAFRDGTTLKPNPITSAKSRGDLIAVTDADGLASRPDKGWYDDLPTSPAGQRIIVAPAAALSVVAYLSTYPSTDPCVTGLPATLYAREFSRGNSLLLDSGGNIVESVDLPDGGVGLDILALEKDSASGSTDPNLVIRVEGADKSKEGTIVKIKNPELLGAHRMSWRLIGD